MKRQGLPVHPAIKRGIERTKGPILADMLPPRSQERGQQPDAPSGPLGPGGHLKAMLALMGFSACALCRELAEAMDLGGVEWCRQNRTKIEARLREKYGETFETGKWQLVKAVAAAIKNGLPMTIPGLVDEAIRRTIRPLPDTSGTSDSSSENASTLDRSA